MTAPEPRRPPLDRSAVADVTGYWRVDVLQETASTNVDLAGRARAGEPAGLVLVAEHQTSGRGRLDRTWEAPARAGLTFSVLLRPAAEAEQWPWLPLVAGLATLRGVRRASGLPGVALKWPNDVLLGGAKVAGILLERVETDEGAAAIAGIGINVSTTPDELPVPTATSLAIAGAEVDRAVLLTAVLAELPGLLELWELGTDELRAAYVAECDTLGQVVEVSLPSGETLTGRAVGIDEQGRLDVETASGRTAVGAGDVVHVR
ncbi:MAG TPA: biotin--[acetyl-CoA-carboxylase] ligase [Nocardioidaceae bacterium]|nr:biotin--[acetyl-CoA-carboxylase] ligase [Nocardioidaceae bacterium]